MRTPKKKSIIIKLEKINATIGQPLLLVADFKNATQL